MASKNMGITRRGFLSRAVAAGLVATVPDLGAVSVDEDKYTNGQLGVALRKPPTWHFASVKAFNANFEDRQDRLSRPDLESAIRELNGDDPILVIAKRSLRSRHLVPTIQLLVDPVSHAPSDFRRLVRLGASAGAEYYEDYVLERDVEFTRLGEYYFGHFVATYAESIDDTRNECRLNCGVVMTKRVELTIGSIGLSAGRDECTPEFLHVVRSLELS